MISQLAPGFFVCVDGHQRSLFVGAIVVADRCVALARLPAANGWCIFSLAGRASQWKNLSAILTRIGFFGDLFSATIVVEVLFSQQRQHHFIVSPRVFIFAFFSSSSTADYLRFHESVLPSRAYAASRWSTAG
jgi:hypothetical protein